MEKFTDNTIITFGKWKGAKLANVPSAWLLWWDEYGNNPNQQLKDYITDNKMVLMQESDLEKLKR